MKTLTRKQHEAELERLKAENEFLIDAVHIALIENKQLTFYSDHLWRVDENKYCSRISGEYDIHKFESLKDAIRWLQKEQDRILQEAIAKREAGA